MESRVETHTPAKPEMERKNKSIPTKLHWLSSYIYAEIRTILSSDWEQNKLIGCMDFYLRCAREESVKGKKTTNLTKIIPRNMYLFKDMNTKFGPSPAYLNRIAKMLQLYLDAELRASIQGIILYNDIANKISMQIDAHLKNHDPSYILSVFLTSQRSQIKSHRRVLDLLYGKYLTVEKKWSVSRTELPDRLMLMYIIAYKQWVNLFLDDKTKVLNIMKEFTMFKPRDTFMTNPKIPESLRTMYSQSGLVKELLTTSEKVDVLKKGLDGYLDEEEYSMEDFLVDDLTKMTMTIGESQDTALSTAEEDSSLTEYLTVSSQESVPMPLSRSAMSRVVKQEEPQTLAIIDLTDEETHSQPRQWLQNLVRVARDKQEVAMTKSSSSSGVADVICLSDTDDSDGQNDVGVSATENSDETTTSESPVNIRDNLMDWAEEGANSMAKNREMLDSITSNLDEMPNPHKLSPQQRVEKTSLTSANATKTAMMFGVRDDLVGSSPRKVTTGESVSETSICTAEDNSLSGGVEDSQNSVDNYPIFNEIRMVERGGENYERVTDIEAPPMDHGDYFCDDLEAGCSMMRTTSNPDAKSVGEKRRRQSSDGQTSQQENIVFTMPPLTRRPLATDDDPAAAITTSSAITPSDKILFSTSSKSPQLPIDESLNIIVRDIMADFSDVEEDDMLPDDEDVSMDEEPDIESPTMETIEKAELVEFIEQICESGHQEALAEPIKSILDRSTAKEKSAKVKKTVKFGTAQYLEPDDVPFQRFAVDYFGGMSPRKAILKSSLKRTLQSGAAAAGVSSGAADSGLRMIPLKDYSKNTPMSNIMVKRTYLSPDMLPHSQQSRSVSHIAAPLTTDPLVVKPSESTETDLSSETLPTTKIVEKEGKTAIRREFEGRRKKMKRRNSIACINYTEPAPASEVAKEDPPPQVTESKRSEKVDPKLFAAYVSLVRVSVKPNESLKKKSNHVPDPSTATSPSKLSKEMREKPWRDYPLYTGLTPTRMTRSMRRRILELELQDEDSTPLRTRKRPRLMSTIELVSSSRVREESSEAVVPKVIQSQPLTSTQSQESPVPSVVENPKTGSHRPPRRKSISGVARKIVKSQKQQEVVSKPQNLMEVSEVAESQQKVVPDVKNSPILSVTKASRKEIVSPVVQLQELIVGQDVKDSSISIVPEIPKSLTLSTPIVQVERLKKEVNAEVKTSPKTSPTPKPPVIVRQDLIPLSKQAVRIIRKDVKSRQYRAIVRTRRLTMSEIERVVDHVRKNPDSNVDSLMRDGQFFLMQSSKSDGNSPDETLTRQDEKIPTVDPATDIPDETTDQMRQENLAESCMEGIADATNEDDESSTGKNSKRGRRSEGKRSKTPRRLKRSQSYQKIIEDSLVVMEQIQVKPLSLLSMNEEIGKMASPDSTSSHGEVNKNSEEQFQGKAVSPEYVNPSISSTVNTEISSTTQITLKQQGDKSPSQVNRKQHRLGFNGPVLRSMSGGMTSGSSSSPVPPNTEAVSCDSQGDLCEPKKGKTPQCDSQTDEDKSRSDETIEKQIEEIMKEGVDVDKDEEEKSKESPLGCDSQGDSEQCQSEECEKMMELPEDNAEERKEEDIPMKEDETENCKPIEEKEDERIVPVSEDAMEKKSEEENDDESIDFQDFDSISEYSNVNSPTFVNENDGLSDKPETTPCDPDKSSFDAAMMHFDPSEAFKDTSDIESQDEEVEDTHNINLKDNLFENISSIESTEQNYLVDNCALLTSGHQAEEESETKNPSPDSSNVHNTSSAVDSGDPMDISCDAMPDTSVNFLPSTNDNDVDANTLGIDDQQRYVEHDGLFSSPIYDPEPLDVHPVDQRSKFNGQIAHQLMYSENQLLEADSSENIGENLAIDDLVEEMPSDETTLITESDIFEEYCENLTSIGDNVTVETESEIVTEPFGGEEDEVARQTTDTVDFSSVFKTCLPEMTSVATSLSAVSSSFLSSTFPSEVPEVRKSYRQRIKSHTNLYVGHDYSPKTDTNRVTPTSTKTGDRYLLPPKSDRLNRKRTYSGDGRERRKNRHKVWTNITSYSYNPILPPPPPPSTAKLPPPPPKVAAPTSSISSVSSYLEVHNSLQQQIEKESRMPPMFPMPSSSSLMSMNGEGGSMRKYRRPPNLPVYEQISPCMTETRVKAFKMIPSNQSIAALETITQKRPPPTSTGSTIEILSDRVIQPRREGYGGYELMTQNTADFCIISGASRQSEQGTHTDSKAFLTPQPEELPHFVVHDTDLVADCLGGVK